jgi:hypothetical protein
VSRAEIESVGFQWGSLDEALARYDVKHLPMGWNTSGSDGERFFYVPNPALGLWAYRQKYTI